VHSIRIGAALIVAVALSMPAAAQIYGQGKAPYGQPPDQGKSGTTTPGQGEKAKPAPTPFEDGMRAYGRREYQDALRIWTPLAHRGDGAAQYNIGRMYARGEGVRRDLTEAYMWFTVAGRSGRPESERARRVIAQSMTPTQVAEGLRRAEQWRQRHR
jgi:TPR repeat protein